MSRSSILQLYRTFVIYSKSYWVIAFPSLVYLASIGTCPCLPQTNCDAFVNVIDTAMGILYCHQSVGQDSFVAAYIAAYFSICASLNVLLTLMIAGRLALHNRNMRNAIGASSGAGGLYKAIITMLVESSAVYAISCLLYMVPSISGDFAIFGLSSIPVGEIQVRTIFTFPRGSDTFDIG